MNRKTHFGLTALVALTFAFGSASAEAGALTITSSQFLTSGGVSCDGDCGLDLVGVGDSSGDPFKLSGGGTFVSDGTPGTIIAQAVGTLELTSMDEFFIEWDFTTSATGGTASWNLQGSIDIGVIDLGFGPFDLGEFPFELPSLPFPITEEHHVGDFDLANPFPFDFPPVDFTAEIAIDWDAPAGETFEVFIPTNSFDLGVQSIIPVPEPSTLWLASLGMLTMGLTLWRKRRA